MFCFFRYTVFKLPKDLQVDLSVDICIDTICETIHVLDETIIPIPICNDNFTLPGGDTVNGFFEQLAQQAGGAGVKLALEYLGIAVSIGYLHGRLKVQ